jgi:hypothetical protein
MPWARLAGQNQGSIYFGSKLHDEVVKTVLSQHLLFTSYLSGPKLKICIRYIRSGYELLKEQIYLPFENLNFERNVLKIFMN